MTKCLANRQHAKAIVELGKQNCIWRELCGVGQSSSHGLMASQGGQHDWMPKGTLAARKLEEHLFELPIGELSEIIETQHGFHVVRVLDRKGASKTSFFDAQTKIKETLQEERRKKAIQAHIERVRRQIPVEIFVTSESDS